MAEIVPDAAASATAFRPRDPDDVARRLARYRETHDPSALWPGLTETRRVAAARALERVARRVLAGETHIELDAAESRDTYALGVAGHTTGLGPLVGRWIEAGAVSAPDAARDAFLEHLAHARARWTRMEREVLPAIDALLRSGIVPTVLKGFHTGRAYLEDVGLRPMADVDLLVAPARIPDAEAALTDAGFRPVSAALRPYKRDWLAPGVDDRVFSLELTDVRSKWILELHASLDRVHHPGAVARLDPVRDRLVPLDVAGREVRALAPPLLVVHLACHCSQELDSIRLLRVFELATVIRAADLDWRDVLILLEETRSAAFTFPAFALVEQLAPGTVDARVLEAGRLGSTRAARATVRRLAPSGGSLDERGILRQLMWTRGVVGIAQRVWRTLWPAAFDRPADVIPGWRARLRRLRGGALSLRGPNERDWVPTEHRD